MTSAHALCVSHPCMPYTQTTPNPLAPYIGTLYLPPALSNVRSDLALWFWPFDSPWRATGWLMLEYGLMLCARALMLRWQLTRQPSAVKALTVSSCCCFCICPRCCLGCVSPCCGRHRLGAKHSAPYNTFFGNTMAGC